MGAQGQGQAGRWAAVHMSWVAATLAHRKMQAGPTGRLSTAQPWMPGPGPPCSSGVGLGPGLERESPGGQPGHCQPSRSRAGHEQGQCPLLPTHILGRQGPPLPQLRKLRPRKGRRFGQGHAESQWLSETTNSVSASPRPSLTSKGRVGTGVCGAKSRTGRSVGVQGRSGWARAGGASTSTPCLLPRPHL